jgi:hypothetical protein
MRGGLKIVLLVSLALTGACAHHEVRVDCDGPLRPINPPAPKAAPVPAAVSDHPTASR